MVDRGAEKLWGFSTGWMLAAMTVTTILCQSWGASFLFVGGLACMACYKKLRTGALLIILLLIPPTYVSTRTLFKWNGAGFSDVLLKLTDPARTQSMMFRIGNEEEILKRAFERPVFGWGGYARAFQVRGVSIFDSYSHPIHCGLTRSGRGDGVVWAAARTGRRRCCFCEYPSGRMDRRRCRA